MRILYITIVLFLPFLVFSQNPSRGYKNLEKDDYEKAEELFLKIIEKDTANCAANFGLAYIYALEDHARVDYFKAWNHFQIAYRNQDKLTDDDKEAIKEHITRTDPRRRSKPLANNFDLEKEIIQDKLITYVREENKLELAEKFIRAYPSSKYIENVYHIRNYIEFRRAEDANTLTAFNTFLANYPDAAQVEMVTQMRNRKAFEHAKAKNTLEAINTFMEKYPDAEEVFEAEGMRNHLAFQEAKKENTLQAIDQFLRNYPNATETTEARNIKRKLLFEEAKKINTLEAYNSFVKLYPEGRQYIDIFNLKANVLGRISKENNKIKMPDALFFKGFDRNQTNDINKDILVMDDRVILVGKTYLEEEKNWEAWILALDQDGKMIWNKSFGQQFDDGIKCVALSPKGNLFLGGIMNAMGDTVKGRSWIVKMDKNGTISWSKTLRGHKINTISLDDNEFVYAGGTRFDSIDSKCMLFKLDTEGETIWTREYLQNGEIESVEVIHGETLVFTGNNWLVKLSNEGYILWEKLITPSISPLILDISDDLIIASGVRDSVHILLEAYDFEGNEFWKQNIETSLHPQINTLHVDEASISLLFHAQNSFNMREYNKEGEQILSKDIPAEQMRNKAKFRKRNGIYWFSGTARNFNQKDYFLIKFQ